MHEALYYDIADSIIQCRLCPIACRLHHGMTGRCRSRQNIDGKMQLLNYGRISALHVDPMEKKPLYHFLPGQSILSLGNNGCNLQCPFCQNWQISQESVDTTTMTPRDVVAQVKKLGLPAVAFTYAEPLVWFEFVLDTARELRESGIKTVLVTNGMINEDPLKELLQWIDAMNVDIKSMDSLFYSRLCKGFLEPVLKTCIIAATSCHLEITNLVIPGENDSDANFHDLASFIQQNLGRQTPLHLSRYHPAYRMTHPATPPRVLLNAREIAQQYLDYVYIGNLHLSEDHSTLCPKCGKLLIDRSGYAGRIISVNSNGLCRNCGFQTGIVMQ